MDAKNGFPLASRRDVQGAIDLATRHADEITILFVTSLRAEIPRDTGDVGLLQLAQHYTESQANDIISAFRSIPVTVRPFFSERELLSYFVNEFDRQKLTRFPLVYTTAEGGTGSGRRGLIPAVSRFYGVPCCNSGAYGSSIGRHKHHANLLAKLNKVSVPESWYFMRDGRWFGGSGPPRGAKVILKPTYELASIGISARSVMRVAPGFEETCRSLLTTWQQPVSVQEFRSGFEIGVPVAQLPDECALPLTGFAGPSELRYGPGFRTFEQENLQPSRAYFLPDFLSDDQINSISLDAIRAFRALELEGVGRIDMRIDEDGRWYAFDLNESPPPVFNSAMGFSLQSLGLNYAEFLAFLVGLNLRLRYPHDVT